MLACQQRLTAHTINVTVNAKGVVLEYDQPSTSDQASGLPETPELLDYLTSRFTSLIVRGRGCSSTIQPDFSVLHDDGNAKDWFSYIMALKTNSSDFLDPHIPLPNPLTMAAHISTTYQMLVAISLGRYYAKRNLLTLNPDNSTSIPGTISYRTKRVAVSTPMFILSAVILSLNLLVATAYFIYTCRNSCPGPRTRWPTRLPISRTPTTPPWSMCSARRPCRRGSGMIS